MEPQPRMDLLHGLLADADRLMELCREAAILGDAIRARLCHLEGRPVGQFLTAAAGRLAVRGLASLQVRCLGRFEVRRGGEPLALCSSKRGQAVFKYLLSCRERRATRDHLMELFWPDSPLEAAQHSLRVAVHALRRSLDSGGGETCLIYRAGLYEINPAMEIDLDVDRFLALQRAAQEHDQADRVAQAAALYEQAVALYGEFLPEDVYEDWTVDRRAHLETLYLGALGRLSQLYDRQGAYLRSLETCRAILERDRCREDAHRQAMRCMARLGQRDGALRQYRQAERILADEFGARPSPETWDLMERIARGDLV